MKFLHTICKSIETTVERTGRWIDWLSLLLVVIVCGDVLLRSVFRYSLPALQEGAWHLFGLIFLLGAAYTLKYDRHVRVDVFYTRFSPRLQAGINILGTLLFLIPFSVVIMWTAFPFIANSYSIGETSPEAGGLPARYLLKAAIPLGFAMLILQSIALMIKWMTIIFPGKLKQMDKS